jgi:hypothetical protein
MGRGVQTQNFRGTPPPLPLWRCMTTTTTTSSADFLSSKYIHKKKLVKRHTEGGTGGGAQAQQRPAHPVIFASKITTFWRPDTSKCVILNDIGMISLLIQAHNYTLPAQLTLWDKVGAKLIETFFAIKNNTP